MSEELQFILNDNGLFEEYDDKYDVTIHCETEEEQEEVLRRLSMMPKLQEWLSSFNPDSATECFTAVQELREKIKTN